MSIGSSFGFSGGGSGGGGGTISGGGTLNRIALFYPNGSSISDSILSQVTDPDNPLVTDVQINGSFIPDSTLNNRNLGASTRRWNTLYMASNIDYSSDLLFKSGGVQNIRMSTGGDFFLNDNKNIDVENVGSKILNLGLQNAEVINIGTGNKQKTINVGSQSTLLDNINIYGNIFRQNVTDLLVKDKLFTVNDGGAVASGFNSGFNIQEGGVDTGWFMTNSTRDGWEMKAPNSFTATLILSALSQNRNITLPNSDGTLALLSDLSGYVSLSGSYSNPSWLTSLDWSKLSGTPTTLSGYGISDAVPSSRNITINDITKDLSNNISFDVYIKSPIKLNSQWSYTGSTTEQKVLGVELTGILDANDVFRFLFSVGGTSNANNKTFRAYINTSNAIGGTQIATYTITTNSLITPFGRDITFNNSLSSQTVASTVTSLSHYLVTSSSSPSSLSINFAGTVWFILTAQLANSSDTAYVHYGISEIFR